MAYRFLGILLIVLGCKSSEPEPIDAVATEYCAAGCSELLSCERVVDQALKGICPDQTRAWYVCVTMTATDAGVDGGMDAGMDGGMDVSRCDFTACNAEWLAREACVGVPDGGMDAGMDGGT